MVYSVYRIGVGWCQGAHAGVRGSDVFFLTKKMNSGQFVAFRKTTGYRSLCSPLPLSFTAISLTWSDDVSDGAHAWTRVYIVFIISLGTVN